MRNNAACICPTDAINLACEPLGVMHAWMWARHPKAADCKCLAIKEEQRWIEGYEQETEGLEAV